MSISQRIEKFMRPMAAVMNKSKHLKAIRNAFVLILPFTLVGSIFTALATFPFMEGFLGAELVGFLTTFVSPASQYSAGIIALFVAIGIGYHLSNEYGVNAINGAMVGMVNFLIQAPFTVNTESGEVIYGVLSFADLGPNATFTAIIVSMISVEIYRYIIQKKWTIKMPESVPTIIAESFTCFIPAIVVMFLGLLVRYGFSVSSFSTMTAAVYQFVQAPLSGLGTSFIATVLIGILCNLFWFLGLHGQSLVFGMMGPIWGPLSGENIQALAAGEAIPNLMSSSFFGSNVALGGWIAVPMLIAIFLYKKRKDWNELGKLALIPGVFNIYEPLMFGFPLVLNPLTLVPMILTPIITTSVIWGTMAMGLIPYANGLQLPATTPLGLVGLLTTNSIMGGLIQLALVPLLTAIWYFTLKFIDRAEKANAAEAVNEPK